MILGIDASNIREGGGVRHLSEILDNVEPSDFGFTSVTLWIGEQQGKIFKAKYSWLNVVTVRYFDLGILLRYIWRKTKLKKSVNNDCDILFSPGGLTLGTIIPEVTMCRNMQPFDSRSRKIAGYGKERLRLEVLKIAQSLSFKSANKVIFLNPYVKKLISNKLELKGGVVIPHGCSNLFRLKPREQFELSTNSHFEILYVSSFNSYKHHLELVEAFGKVNNVYKNSKLTLVGSASSEELIKLTKLIELHSIENVNFVGKVEPQELHKYYHRAHIFVYPSSCENLPNILLESMKAGLPIVCSDIEPMPTVLKEGGIYCSPFQASSIEKALVKAIENPLIRKDISLNAFHESNKYNWQYCANQTFTLLSNIARDYNEKR